MNGGVGSSVPPGVPGVPAVRAGVRLCVDFGSVRIGVAASDADAGVAVPVETVPRRVGDVDRIAELAAERAAVEVVVGLPVSLSGREGPAAQAARAWATTLAARVAPLPVRLVDERLTTAAAHRSLRAAGVGGRTNRAVVDQAAAAVILQDALARERATGQPPGEVVITS